MSAEVESPFEPEAACSFAHLNRARVRQQAFSASQLRYVTSKSAVAHRINPLYVDALHKVVRRQSTAAPGPTTRRQNMIAATRVVAKWLRAERANENGSGGMDLFEQSRVSLRQRKMLRCKAIDERDGLLP